MSGETEIIYEKPQSGLPVSGRDSRVFPNAKQQSCPLDREAAQRDLIVIVQEVLCVFINFGLLLLLRYSQGVLGAMIGNIACYFYCCNLH
jgi:hypothetical protein